MALLAGMEFHFEINYHQLDLEEAEEYLKSIASKYSDIIFKQSTEVHVRLEEGSLKVRLAILGAIYLGIGQYGSFRSGIEWLIKDAKSLKELVTSYIVGNGLNESDILESRRLYCDPDRIKRVFLAIDRFETKKDLSKEESLKEISKIKASIRNICHRLDGDDTGLLISSISKRYWPGNGNIPSYYVRYKIIAREEDFSPFPVASNPITKRLKKP